MFCIILVALKQLQKNTAIPRLVRYWQIEGKGNKFVKNDSEQ